MNEYVETGLRALIGFALMLVLARFMGRKQLSHITFFNYIVGITIGSIAAELVVDRSIKLLDCVIAILLWALLPVAIGFVSLHSLRLRDLVEGRPKVIIQNGVFVEKNMRLERYNVGDLLMQLRDKGVFDLSEVDCAILEPNGTLSVLKKPQSNPATVQDLGLTPGAGGLMVELIIDGRVISQSLASLGKDEAWLLAKLREMQIPSPGDVVFAGCHPDGRFYVSRRCDVQTAQLL